MNRLLFLSLLFFWQGAAGQSMSFSTFMNPVIPGDHPDPTLTRVGNDFYTTGSSFNPTPRIYHSTDLVHWEVISQPVSASWASYGDAPAGGIWGGHMVYHNGMYWDFFGRNGQMYVVSASDPHGPWSTPSMLNAPSGVPGLGQDNSIFIDDNNRWYLLVKNGQSVNYIVELGSDGKPAGDVHNLSWLNPGPAYPYSWAEGPVMWKYKGRYYYSFARNLGGGQYAMSSDTLTGDQSAWLSPGDFFSAVPNPADILFNGPNHSSPVVLLDDSTSWVMSQAYSKGNSLEWTGIGRQGILSQVTYKGGGTPVADYPSNDAVLGTRLPSSGIPWMVPKSDMFDSLTLNPEWSFLGYTPDNTHSLTERPGWLKLSPKGGPNTVIKNDAEHNYSLITRMDFSPSSTADEAGFWIFNGLETLHAKLYATVNDSGKNVVRFNFTGGASYEAENTVGDTIWLKLYRDNHDLTGYFSADGMDWTEVGSSIDVQSMDTEQPDYNAFTGSQQGLYVQGKSAFFDLYIYRDAYSRIMAYPAASQYGTLRAGGGFAPLYLDSITSNNWALYAGVEFGGSDYPMSPDSIEISAASAVSGGTVQVWLDSIATGTEIGECTIGNTGDWSNFQTFTAPVTSTTGRHDVYLRFRSTEPDRMFRVYWFRFVGSEVATSVESPRGERSSPLRFELNQNYPNPFNPSTTVSFFLPRDANVSLAVFDLLGRKVATIASGLLAAGEYSRQWDAEHLPSGLYLCQLRTGSFVQTRKLLLLK